MGETYWNDALNYPIIADNIWRLTAPNVPILIQQLTTPPDVAIHPDKATAEEETAKRVAPDMKDKITLPCIPGDTVFALNHLPDNTEEVIKCTVKEIHFSWKKGKDAYFLITTNELGCINPRKKAIGVTPEDLAKVLRERITGVAECSPAPEERV